ncbi:uncharacterized protein [Drosophila kikkawai]|uniref:Glycosyltransferase family 92 protein n=1 Tax=Drosophila kikkawai TaxID=30033 RepID=A0A6P4J6F6_DROKI|nr:uncharacterized protein LOC108080027 [Drosophila kikkawai]XP_017030100.1 uncharacterized protein LOC108080027 [Drosophila kikkawai]XP_017030108.1 uncharacterized protein LOC108080027 [Drosophila kikkawai]XP_041631016.1 uncharacterized protein LOC108080027 [Drosophila kikkawai]XP_041631017.1 uncharacterized protein LOC108080027 [Drosophila kikkawai]XP_041631018.1 uncharacterized protein LOC108080027 [Drosophila kikkawai]KAH8289253.1 hypothetical protein KR054_002401 [Drosophila jambulina]K
MAHSKVILKILFSLCVWSFVIIGLFKMHGTNLVPQEYQQVPLNGRILLQKDMRYAETTSTTTDHFDPSEILVDNRTAMDDDQLVRDVESRIPSLPIAYWSKNKNFLQQKSSTCAKYPSIFELEFNNIYWQTLRTSNGTFQLFGAYYDIRRTSLLGPTVRILGMIDRIEPKVKTYCQFWFDGQKEPFIVKTFEYKYIWYNKWGNYKQGIYQPYLIACQIPKPFHGVVPSSVSMVEKECDTATNNLRVIYNRPPDDQKKGFAVCVKGLDFLYDDLSVRLIEWIEMLNILGADKIYFYNLQVHPNITKVLNHYEQEGKVQVIPLTLPGGQPNVPGFQHLYLTKKTNHKRQNEVIPYNDCLYKNLYLYDYIALLDIDEVIMPKGGSVLWSELMDKVRPESRKIKPDGFHSYNFRNVYFLDDQQHEHGWHKDIPKYMHMLQHVHRAKNYTKPNQYVKCFHDPERVLTLHNHFPLSCLGGVCKSYPVDTQDAQLQHYRADCVKTLKKSCEEYREHSVEDKTIWKYKDELIRRTIKALDTLGFFRRQGLNSASGSGGSSSGLGGGATTHSTER